MKFDNADKADKVVSQLQAAISNWQANAGQDAEYIPASPEDDQSKMLKLAIAYSGGLDSSVLLHAAHHLAQQAMQAFARPVQLFAFHIHHGLSKHADAWLAHCAETCTALGIGFASQRLQLENWQDSGLEEAARLQRYAALGKLCQQHGIQLLLTAHHLDDQAETMLLHLFRGTGVAGLGGMASFQGNYSLLANPACGLLRPLLALSREDLQSYAQQHQLKHIVDESNDDAKYTRNALRHQVMPQIGRRFTGYQQRLARTAEHMQAAQRLLRQLAELDMQSCRDGDELKLPNVLQLDQDRRDNLLRHWLASFGRRMPSAFWLKEMWQQLQTTDQQAHPCISLPDCEIRLYQQKIYLTAKYAAEILEQAPQQFQWQGQAQIDFPQFQGSLQFIAVEAGQFGLDAAWLREQQLELHFRRGAERIKLAENRPTRSLKQHYQSLHIPPWQRTYLPLLSCQQQLLFAPQLGMAWPSLTLAGGQQPCIRLHWQAWLHGNVQDDA